MKCQHLLRRFVMLSALALFCCARTAAGQAPDQSIAPNNAPALTSEEPPMAGIVRPRQEGVNQPQIAATNMTYHGGPVQHTQKVFTIFWAGPSATGLTS